MIEEKVIIRRIPEPEADYGWTVSVVRKAGPHRGAEHCLVMCCGGSVGKALAVMCGRQIAESMMIGNIFVDAELATTED